MRGVGVIVSVIAGITGVLAIACSATMTDLSAGGGDDTRPADFTNGGSQPGSSNEPIMLDGSTPEANVDDDDGGVDNKLDSMQIDAGPLAVNCKIVELTPTTALTSGQGQQWKSPTSGIADDGVTSTVSLSTNNRESAQLGFGSLKGEAIPATATVKGVELIVDRSSGGTCIHAGGVGLSINGVLRAKPETDLWQGIRLYGGIDDLWGGGPIAPADVSTMFVGFGTRLVGTGQQCPARDARVDAVRVRVHYCTN